MPNQIAITSKNFIAAIFNQIGTSTSPSTANTLEGHPPNSLRLISSVNTNEENLRSAILALHFLFPHEILPALDLLDRRLITKVQLLDAGQDGAAMETFYVQSASALTEHSNRATASSRFRNIWNATNVHYEVRLDAWNCTCAAFAQSQLRLLVGELQTGREHGSSKVPGLIAESQVWTFGGVATIKDADIPVCKHILAAAICTAAPDAFSNDIKCKDASVEELAAWCAGWEDS